MRDQRRPLLGEVLVDNAARRGVHTRVGDPRAPVVELAIQVVEVAKGPGQEEIEICAKVGDA
jgi:hypothetical protein